jgi:putative membrane protein
MNKHAVLIVLFFLGLIASAINPHDYFTWILEVFPAIIGFVVLVLTYKRFQFTYLTYVAILLHCYILFIGGHYTYAEVPAFNWIRDTFQQTRNNYDKVGHFTQGFVPAMIARELFIRCGVILKKGWVAFLTVCVCMSISVIYEFIEWFVSVTSGSSGDSFLGTQGDIWDTQSDMLFATIGAICMVEFLGRVQDRAIKSAPSKSPPVGETLKS